MNPLTHHEILGLVGPFAQRGRHVDLAATDRLRRRVAFKSIHHPAAAELPSLHETLELEDLGEGSYRLTRALRPPNGADARLEASGHDPGELLLRIDEVPPGRHFHVAPGVFVSWSFRLNPRTPSLLFTSGVGHAAGLVLKLTASSVARDPAKIALIRAPGDVLQLPEDALAVLGGAWSRLRETTEGWAGELRVRGREPTRSDRAEAALGRAAAHLAHMLEQPPSWFHEHWVAARWAVFGRRLVPLAACIGLIVCAAAVPKLHLESESGLRMLILNSPPMLMMLFFCLREIPIVEIPPVPRRSAARAWRAEPVPAARAPLQG